jgi:PST family polysaccharide transporter
MVIKSIHKFKTLFLNMQSLVILQIAKYIFPLITMPYLIRVVGIEGYGMIALAQTITGYFIMFTNYGFYLSAPRLVAINRDNKQKLNEIFSSVTLIKTLFMLISIGIMSIAAYFIPFLKQDYTVYIVAMLAVVSEVIFPVWFFQGMENMIYITMTNIIARTITTLLMFVFVKDNSDIVVATLLQTSGGLIGGVISLYYIFNKYGIKWVTPSYDSIKHAISGGWNLFISQLSTTLFSNTNIIILGFFISKDAVGYYAAAEKVVRLVANLISPISSAIYPTVARIFAESREDALSFLKKVLFIGGSIFLLMSIMLFVFANFITMLATGSHEPVITLIIRIMSAMPFFIYVNNIYGTQIMVNCGMQKAFRNIIFFTGISLIGMSLVLTQAYGTIGAGIASILSEFLLVVLMVGYVQHKKEYRLLIIKFM